jgi:hypothetical protein
MALQNKAAVPDRMTNILHVIRTLLQCRYGNSFLQVSLLEMIVTSLKNTLNISRWRLSAFPALLVNHNSINVYQTAVESDFLHLKLISLMGVTDLCHFEDVRPL